MHNSISIENLYILEINRIITPVKTSNTNINSFIGYLLKDAEQYIDYTICDPLTIRIFNIIIGNDFFNITCIEKTKLRKDIERINKIQNFDPSKESIITMKRWSMSIKLAILCNMINEDY